MAADGGAEGIRTPDPHNAIVVLYQLSYDPIRGSANLEGRTELSKQFFQDVLSPPRERLRFQPGPLTYRHALYWKYHR
jgi:hypothetical protein